jgi:mRNA-degrading endonuclease HigB of HigAB toxin-antitoxin module
MYTKASQGSFTFGDTHYFFMVNGNGFPKIVDIYYEKDLTFIEFVSLVKV